MTYSRTLVVALMLAIGPGLARAQAPTAIDGYKITDTHPYDDPQLGVRYRFEKSGEPVYDVYVYPYELPELASTAEGRTRAAENEANSFRAGLPILVQRGYFDEYRLAFAQPDTTVVGSHMLIGSCVAVAIKRHGVVGLTFQYVYGLTSTMLKVRVDIAMAQLKTANIPGFVHDLVRAADTSRTGS